MPRDLLQSDRNELVIQDAISGSDLVLYYRQPATRERIGFQKGCYKEVDGKMINQTLAARAAYGALVLTGIRDGDFVVGGKPLSSDPKSEHFDPEWKKHVEATGGDLLIALGMHVFEGSLQNLVKRIAADTLAGSDQPPPAPQGEQNPEPPAAENDGLPLVDDGGEGIGPLALS